MRLSTTQTVYLDHAHAAHLDRVNAQKTEREIALRLADERIAGKLRDEDLAIRKAFDAGVPKDRIRRLLAIGHSTLEESLLRTEAQPAGESPELIQAPTFQWADENRAAIIVTPSGPTWDENLAEITGKLRKNHDERSGAYKITDGQIAPRVDMYDRTGPNKYDHPVTAWLLYFGGLGQAQAWISEQTGAIAA